MPTNDHYKKSVELLNQGKFNDALKIAENIADDAFRAAIYVDAGFGAQKASKIRQGVELFELLLLLNQNALPFTKSSILYNAANGYYSLYKLKRLKGKKVSPPSNNDLKAAKKLYRVCVASLENDTKEFESQVWVNYGNCLAQLGRYVEAIESYHKALKAEPKKAWLLAIWVSN